MSKGYLTYNQRVTAQARAEQKRDWVRLAAAGAARAERRAAIQPQIDALSAELDAALLSGSNAAINEVGARIDALLASIK